MIVLFFFAASFNTQPPEGGWRASCAGAGNQYRFNTQPPEGGWLFAHFTRVATMVSTHSRPKAAGGDDADFSKRPDKFQHTAARRRLVAELIIAKNRDGVSTHSRPKAAGKLFLAFAQCFIVSTHSRPKAAGNKKARRQLKLFVSTHSRPKAAGVSSCCFLSLLDVSTHSRPKAAGHCPSSAGQPAVFQHTAARRRLGNKPLAFLLDIAFQHTAARRRLASA